MIYHYLWVTKGPDISAYGSADSSPYEELSPALRAAASLSAFVGWRCSRPLDRIWQFRAGARAGLRCDVSHLYIECIALPVV